MAQIALVTCGELAELVEDDHLLLDPLSRRGMTATAAVWDDPQVEWESFDLAVIRSTWDYTARREEFLAWARSVPKLVNPPDVVEWNTDKRYLRDLEAAGLPVVPTQWLEPGDTVVLPGEGTNLDGADEYVIKPSVSAGSADTGRYRVSDPSHVELALQHVNRLLQRGATVMIQPYLSAVDAFGETAMLFFDGELSHAIRKGPMLEGPDHGMKGLYRPELITPRTPSDQERKVAGQVLDAVAGLRDLLYARVDLIPGADGYPMVLELELTEPSLFFEHDAGAADRFAAAVARRV